MNRTADVVICGAGIAGVSTAYHLARVGFRQILLVDPLPPLSLTSDRSTECYRNWWPDGEMVALMNRSIDLLQGLADRGGNPFRMNRRGYLYVTADSASLPGFVARAEHTAELGAGPLRYHSAGSSGYRVEQPLAGDEHARGADLLLDPELIRRHYPYLTHSAVAALHIRRAGWLSAQQLGMVLLEEARSLGATLLRARIAQIDIERGRVTGLLLDSGERISSPLFVDAAGPYLKQVAALLGVDLPVRTELHLKVSFKDHLGVIDREAPLLIWQDTQTLPWNAADSAALGDDAATRWLTEPLPAGVHVRPEGSGESQTILMLWDYNPRWMEPVFPPPLDDEYPEVALRGLSTMLPGLRAYFERAPRPYVDGGYYVKSPENRLLACPLPVQGAFVIGGLSGYGIMSSCAAGELLSAHIAGTQLPQYAPAFSLLRYADPAYQERLAAWDDSGQL